MIMLTCLVLQLITTSDHTFYSDRTQTTFNSYKILYSHGGPQNMSIQVLRGPSVSTDNPVLAEGQPYVDVESNPPKLKIGGWYYWFK